jgi:hypothetical protein
LGGCSATVPNGCLQTPDFSGHSLALLSPNTPILLPQNENKQPPNAAPETKEGDGLAVKIIVLQARVPATRLVLELVADDSFSLSGGQSQSKPVSHSTSAEHGLPTPARTTEGEDCEGVVCEVCARTSFVVKKMYKNRIRKYGCRLLCLDGCKEFVTI